MAITRSRLAVATVQGSHVDLAEIGADSRNPRYEVYLAGWARGYESCEARIQRLEWERDLWYFVASNPGKTPADFYRHATAELWRVAA